jgi:hypothetical protein
LSNSLVEMRGPPAAYGARMKSPREALAELRDAGQLELTDEDIAAIREVTTGAELAEELDDLVPADAQHMKVGESARRPLVASFVFEHVGVFPGIK